MTSPYPVKDLYAALIALRECLDDHVPGWRSVYEGADDDATSLCLVRAAISAIMAQQWQSIETAPRDGTVFMGSAKWVKGRDFAPFVRWCDDYSDFIIGNDPDDESDWLPVWAWYDMDATLTHWMPHPQPPEDA